MDSGLVRDAIESNCPFVIKTASSDSYEIPHRDFVSFSTKRTTLIISLDKDGESRVAYVPLLTVTAVEVLGEMPMAE